MFFIPLSAAGMPFFSKMYNSTKVAIYQLYSQASEHLHAMAPDKSKQTWSAIIRNNLPGTETSLSLGVGALTLITGIAFGFQPLIVFLSVASEYHGRLGHLVKWGLILPSCFFQTMLWWHAYYSAAITTLKEKFTSPRESVHHNTAAKYIHEIQLRVQPWIKISDSQKDLITTQIRTYETQYPKPTADTIQSIIAGEKELAQEDPARRLIRLLTLQMYYRQATSTNREAIEPVQAQSAKVTKLQQLGRTFLATIPVIVNALNYLTINPFGVFFAFYTVMLTLTFPGIELASVALPTSMLPVVLSLLALGYAAGFICAFFLTAKSFRETFDQAVHALQRKLEQYLGLAKGDAGQQDLNNHISAAMQDLQNANTDPTWIWLSSRPILCAVLAFGCALSICIINYNAGIQAAIMLSNVTVLLTPGHLTSTHSIMNATMREKAFGIYSALVTVCMTTGLLYNVATQAIPKEKTENASRHHGRLFYWVSLGFSAAGQLFCNYVNTVKPHGILSALRMIKAPFERVFQSLFGVFGMGGMVIVLKLQYEEAGNLSEKIGLNREPEKSKDDSATTIAQACRQLFISTERLLFGTDKFSAPA